VTALDEGVERGVAPSRVVASHTSNGSVDRTRPLCPYPNVAKYVGRGSIDQAENFRCATPEAAPGVASASRAPARAFTPAKTPWGDPDLQGNYTNKYESGTPFERPQEFEGRRLEDVTGQELVDVVNKRQQTVLENAKFLGG